MTALVKPCVVTAAVRAGYTLIAVPATVPCAHCGGDGIYPEMPDGRPAECWVCYREGTVPFSPSPGDLLDIRARYTLPDDGTRYGEWRAVRESGSVDNVWIINGDTWSAPLSPGEVLTVRVTEGPWPIVDELMLDDGALVSTPWATHIEVRNGLPLLCRGVDGEWICTDVSAHAAFDPSGWTPGAQVIRVEVAS